MDPFERLVTSMEGGMPPLPVRLEGFVDASHKRRDDQEHPSTPETAQPEAVVPKRKQREVSPRTIGAVALGAKEDDWRNEAECLEEDPELFFPIGNTGPYITQAENAKAVCRRCTVVDTCLQFALDHDQDGIWGGTTAQERHAIKRRGFRVRRNS